MARNEKEEQLLGIWYKKRRLTTVSSILAESILHFEYSSVSISALYYFSKTFKIPDADRMFSLTMGIMYLTSILSTYLVGGYMDRTRNFRRIITVLLIISFISNIIYILPFSKWLPVISRAISGISAGLPPAISGEFSRCYTKEELGRILSIYHVSCTFFFAIGPASPVLFQHLHFNIGPVTINQYNFIGVFQASIILLVLLTTHVMVRDLSKEPGYQVFLDNIDYNTGEKVVDLHLNSNEKERYYLHQAISVRNILSDNLLVILIVGNSFLNFLACHLELIMNMTALYNFSWSVNKLGFISLTTSTTVCGVVLILNHKILKDSMIVYYFMFILTFISAMIALTVVLFSANMEGGDSSTKLILYVTFWMCALFFGYGVTTYSRWILFALIPHQSACFADAMRLILCRMIACMGFFTAAEVYKNNQNILPIYYFICFVFTLIFILRKASYFSRVKI